MRRALWLLALFGCRTQPIVRPDLGAPPPPDLSSDLARPIDLAVERDFALPNACTFYARNPMLLSSIALVDPQPRRGQVVRVVVEYPLRDCDRPADVAFTVQPGSATDFVSVSAFAWTSSGNCGATTPRTVVASIPEFMLSGNPRLAIRDAAVGGTARLDIDVLPQLGDCTAVATGAACTRTCQCPSSVSCIPTGGGAGVCALACVNDFDCQSTCRPDGDPPYTCFAGPAPKIPTDIPGQTCRCQAECPDGELCGAFGCIHPCTTHSECPGTVDYCSNGECVRVL